MSWSEAIRTMAARFKEIRDRYGAEAVGVISTGQLVTEEFYTLGKLVQLGLGTRNYDGNTTLCMSTAVAGYKRSFGSDGPPGAYEDLERADVDGVIRIASNADRASVLDADEHPAAHRAVAAGGLDPPIGDLAGGGVAHHGIGRVGVALRPRVEAERARQPAHAASLPT